MCSDVLFSPVLVICSFFFLFFFLVRLSNDLLISLSNENLFCFFCRLNLFFFSTNFCSYYFPPLLSIDVVCLFLLISSENTYTIFIVMPSFTYQLFIPKLRAYLFIWCLVFFYSCQSIYFGSFGIFKITNFLYGASCNHFWQMFLKRVFVMSQFCKCSTS